MAKEVKQIVKLQIQAGKATPAPPVGTALGPHGLNIQEFCTKFNDATKDRMGEVVPVELKIYIDRTFDFVLKTAPVADMIKKKINLKKGSGNALQQKVGQLTDAQLTDIAEAKMPDLNANDIEAAKRIVAGTARQMGVKIEEK
ncbi:MAG: 50S ribosomal protein L11 [Candidatus Komeilibacteria bacterium CG11_big_fil_rev_8_21_14_0_20_36_20]|uniref:Large ribosomal subunit protein uL11 n=1 Tax=Candidatus Komeilibacteria bacterium CG11_big_fil_rev_8_21_14_0_20_36_20 TaxID=1974477 RepID=A0A2H0NDV5_9BACT|nr:MAG: 50S ribosomal protein L11 [Candidatus Komeilibacteria bacterium CG11_big_fil_rev_8_21_14_0_20_36_20]PIR81215.1 MAG: 50S ribosomal protein L11 [Candidatus Komeilibacteria bacterium CG10_big_fil_rev_8_21_14_0_10_36_65]PJC55179.1 MAG: 50S ribosomal protein L11 [Candidatus Komeilibacteria bacterium CG_4_9_14_0_2_um_filter_36_13]